VDSVTRQPTAQRQELPLAIIAVLRDTYLVNARLRPSQRLVISVDRRDIFRENARSRPLPVPLTTMLDPALARSVTVVVRSAISLARARKPPILLRSVEEVAAGTVVSAVRQRLVTRVVVSAIFRANASKARNATTAPVWVI